MAKTGVTAGETAPYPALRVSARRRVCRPNSRLFLQLERGVKMQIVFSEFGRGKATFTLETEFSNTVGALADALLDAEHMGMQALAAVRKDQAPAGQDLFVDRT